MTNIDRTALESLRTFAVQHNELEFAHLCTAALNGEQWAIDRMRDAIFRADYRFSTDATVLREIRSTDTTRPDGATARKMSAPV